MMLQSVLRKVTPEDAPQISDPIMRALLQMLSSSSGKSSGVQEDALLAVSTLVEGEFTWLLWNLLGVLPHVLTWKKKFCKWWKCGQLGSAVWSTMTLTSCFWCAFKDTIHASSVWHFQQCGACVHILILVSSCSARRKFHEVFWGV